MTFLEIKNYMITELSDTIKALEESGEIKCAELFSPRTDVAVVLRDLFNLSRTDYIMSRDFDITQAEYTRALAALEDLKALKPVQYITGKCEFMSLEFHVDENTLIPRADTETLVEYVLEKYKNSESVRILDIGTGSGCIAVSLAYYLKNARITAIDVSEGALAVARNNAMLNGVSDRVEFIKHDILNGFVQCEGEFDCIVSNPPYIETLVIDTLENNVKDYEPNLALDGGEDGLDFYREIIRSCRLKRGGVLAFEIGFNQGEALLELFDNSGKFENAEIVKDLCDCDRVAAAVCKEDVKNNK